MKVALVHELLTMKGGAEGVLRILARMFPDAPIYTLLYDEAKLGEWFPKERVRTSNLQNSLTTHYSRLTTHSINHHLYLKKFPKAVEAWDFSEFDLVISSSSAFAHGIITNGKPKHLCYVHSPARYLWDRNQDVLERSTQGLFGSLKRNYLQHVFHKLRLWDAEVAPRPDKLLAASGEVQRRIKLYWNRDSEVVYPPINDAWLSESTHDSRQTTHEPYFLIVSTLVDYKRIDLAIRACNELKLPLKIAGEGPARASLEKIAGPTITFLGYQPHDALVSLFTNATATIVPGEEDFGLVPLESMACGTPVIGFRKGGLMETAEEGETGAFFEEKTPESLMKILASFDRKSYSIEKCRENALKYRETEFVQKLNTIIKTMVSDPR